jgi:16S rRNA (guanine527-N7)-methyltransferase
MNGTTAIATALETLCAQALDGTALPPDAPARLEAYLALLAKWNRTFNLTAIRDPDRMVTHHVLDALAVLPHLPNRPSLRLLDVGSGGGVPGIPLAIARPGWHVVLLDSNHKKGAFLAQAVIELRLQNAEAVTARVEEYAPAAPFDVVISRAFSDLAAFVRAALPHLASGGCIVAMKGVYPDEEIAELPQGVHVVGAPNVIIPGLDAERHLIVIEREASA